MIDAEELKQYMKDHTNAEAAKHFNVSKNTICRLLKKHGLNYHELKYGTQEITKAQDDVIVGSLLGDGSLRKGGRKHDSKVTAEFSVKQKIKNKEYIEWIANTMKPYFRKIEEGSDVVRGKRFLNCRYTSGYQPIFSQYVNKWYPDKTKIVPLDLILNDKIVTHWFMQDGTNHWARRMAAFATHCFRKEEVLFLIERIRKDLNIIASLGRHYDQWTININPKHYYGFMDLIRPNLEWQCFDYKCDISKLDKPHPKIGVSKLNMEKATEIRSLYATGRYNRAQISKIYDVCITSVSNILNNINYKIPRCYSGGTARVSTIYNAR